jgi:hypothetical protein
MHGLYPGVQLCVAAVGGGGGLVGAAVGTGVGAGVGGTVTTFVDAVVGFATLGFGAGFALVVAGLAMVLPGGSVAVVPVDGAFEDEPQPARASSARSVIAACEREPLKVSPSPGSCRYLLSAVRVPA